MIDAFGKFIDELRADVAVAAITERIRGHQPGPNDARGPGEYIPFVVLTDMGGIPFTKTPVQFAQIGLRCYGVTPQGAKELYVACSNALHDAGPRVHSGVGIYRSQDTTGGDESSDPRTKQPYMEGVIDYIVTTAAVA